MKKYLFIALAATALVSCSQDETLDNVQGEAISFGNAYVGNSTRATSATDPSYYTDGNDAHIQLEAFNVYGTVNDVNIFNGNTVTKGTAAYGAAWEQAGTVQYWVPGAKYVFDAVVDATTTNTDQTTGLPTSLSYTVSTQKDMLHNRVTVESAVADQGIVEFNFKHLLSKVKFSVVNKTAAAATNYRYVIKGAKLTTVYVTGDYAVPAGTWSNQTSGEYALDSELTVNSNSTEFNQKEVLLIPGSAVGVSLTVELQTQVNDEWKVVSSTAKAYTAVLGDSKTLEANKAYNFILEVGISNPIQFTAKEMPAWENGNTTPTDSPTYVPVD